MGQRELTLISKSAGPHRSPACNGAPTQHDGRPLHIRISIVASLLQFRQQLFSTVFPCEVHFRPVSLDDYKQANFRAIAINIASIENQAFASDRFHVFGEFTSIFRLSVAWALYRAMQLRFALIVWCAQPNGVDSSLASSSDRA